LENPANVMDVSIKGNTIENCSDLGVLLYNLTGKIAVNKNVIEVGPNLTDPDIFHFGVLGAFIPDAIIKNNKIKFNGANGGHVWIGDGINDGIVIKNNTCSGTGSPLFAIGLGNVLDSVIKNNNTKAVNPSMAHIYIGTDPSGNGWSENNVFKGNSIGKDGNAYYFDGPAENNLVRGYCGAADRIIDVSYDPPKGIVFIDPDDEDWWIYAEYYFESLSNWMDDTHKDNDLSKPYNYLYEPYSLAAFWWGNQIFKELRLPRTDPMLTITVAGITKTIPMPFYYETSDGQMDLWSEWGGTLEPFPVRGPLKNNIIAGCGDIDDD